MWLRRSISPGVLLLPLLCAAESQVGALNAGARRLNAAAHVDFKIIIPNALSLEIPAV